MVRVDEQRRVAIKKTERAAASFKDGSQRNMEKGRFFFLYRKIFREGELGLIRNAREFSPSTMTSFRASTQRLPSTINVKPFAGTAKKKEQIMTTSSMSQAKFQSRGLCLVIFREKAT